MLQPLYLPCIEQQITSARGTRSRPHPRDQADQGAEGSQYRAPRVVCAGAETLEGGRKETLVPAESVVCQGNLAQIFGVFPFFKNFSPLCVFWWCEVGCSHKSRGFWRFLLRWVIS